MLLCLYLAVGYRETPQWKVELGLLWKLFEVYEIVLVILFYLKRAESLFHVTV